MRDRFKSKKGFKHKQKQKNNNSEKNVRSEKRSSFESKYKKDLRYSRYFRRPKEDNGGFRGPKFKKEQKRDFGSRFDREKFKRNNTRKNFVAEKKSGEVQMNSRGFGFMLCRPDDFFIPPHLTRGLMNGDYIEAEVDMKTKEVLSLELKKRGLKQFIGTYHAGFSGRFVEFSEKNSKVEMLIEERPNIPGLRHEDKVLAEVIAYTPTLKGRILRTFGSKLAPKLDTLSVVVRHQWPQEFSDEVIKYAEETSKEKQEKAKNSDYSGRRDLRKKHFVTIDGRDSRDFDDAVCVDKTQSGYVLYVAIADVAEFVEPGSVLDKAAFERSTSVYFPEWVIPMLPESLSNGTCSLRPNEEKLTLTCEIHYDHFGNRKSYKVYESVIESHRRCVYEDVQKEFESGDEFWKVPFELYAKIKETRKKKGTLDLDLPESKVVLDENGDTIDIKRRERVDAHKLIEEFMIAANESVTEIMIKAHWPFVYRVHEPPSKDAIEKFVLFAQTFGLKPKFGNGDDPKLFSIFLNSLDGEKSRLTLFYMLLRSLKQARYEVENRFHFGLASKAYTHFTSPIRRYPDLMVHRLLKRYLSHERLTEQNRNNLISDLHEQCEHCSKYERKADELARTVEKVKKARFMEKHYGKIFKARISNVFESGLFVELEEVFVEGLVPVRELEGDFFKYIETKHMFKGKRSGKKYKIGDDIKVSVLKIDLDQGLIDFTLSENLSKNVNQKDDRGLVDVDGEIHGVDSEK